MPFYYGGFQMTVWNSTIPVSQLLQTMLICVCVVVCVCVRVACVACVACVSACVYVFKNVCSCESAHIFLWECAKCVLLERSFRQCRSSAFRMIRRPAQLYLCGFVFLLLPPSASSLPSESFVLNFPVCAWLLCCWVQKIKIYNEQDWHHNIPQQTYGGL